MLGDERPEVTGSNAEDNAGTAQRRGPGRPAGKLAEQPVQGFTIDQVLELLNHQSVENQKNLLLAIQELKKPSAEEQAKIDKERAKLAERVLAAARVAQAEEERKQNAAKYCPHGTTHKGTKIFTHQWRAQIHMPAGEKPYYLPRCTQCGSTWDQVFGLPSPKILASPEQMGNPIDMDQWSMDDIHRVVEWAKRNPQETLVGV